MGDTYDCPSASEAIMKSMDEQGKLNPIELTMWSSQNKT